LSGDGQYLMLAGYDAAVGTASVAGTTSAAVNRVIGRVSLMGIIDTSTALNDASNQNNVRSATSTNGTDLWISCAAGRVRYAPLGNATSVQLAANPANTRNVSVVGGQLFVSSGSNNFTCVSTVGTGAPTMAGQTVTPLPGFPLTGASPYDYF